MFGWKKPESTFEIEPSKPYFVLQNLFWQRTSLTESCPPQAEGGRGADTVYILSIDSLNNMLKKYKQMSLIKWFWECSSEVSGSNTNCFSQANHKNCCIRNKEFVFIKKTYVPYWKEKKNFPLFNALPLDLPKMVF